MELARLPQARGLEIMLMDVLFCSLITIGLFALLSWQAHSDWRREQRRLRQWTINTHAFLRIEL